MYIVAEDIQMYCLLIKYPIKLADKINKIRQTEFSEMIAQNSSGNVGDIGLILIINSRLISLSILFPKVYICEHDTRGYE